MLKEEPMTSPITSQPPLASASGAGEDRTPAFPTHENVNDPRTDGFLAQNGMELRDWFAGKAIAGIFADERYANCGNEAACIYEISRYAYCLADAMMEARKL